MVMRRAAAAVFACLLLTASYGGMLRSFLTMPVFEPAIDSLDAVAASGLPVHMGIYGTTQEQIMADSSDLAIKQVWTHKIVDNRDSSEVVGAQLLHSFYHLLLDKFWK